MRFNKSDDDRAISYKTLGYMVHPTDKRNRKAYWERRVAAELLDAAGLKTPRDDIQALRSDELLRYEVGKAIGYAVYTIARSHCHDPERGVGIRQALWLAFKTADRIKTKEREQIKRKSKSAPFPNLSKRARYKHWEEFMPVAHFWAPLMVPELSEWLMYNPVAFHSAANWFLRFGLAFQTKRSRKRLLDRNAVWRSPGWLTRVDLGVSLPPIEGWESSLLESYTADQA